ncbi:hypothetical protein [Pseudonocardia sp.]|uniref:hypothetical protein n=1 Tax=Pseudonocardia sp. TaxID=60912 RepID=UPI002612026B|nr:hypothetical protein [Pseudonocardia sp.]
MTDADGDTGGGGATVPRPRRSGPVRLVGRPGTGAARPECAPLAARIGSVTAVLDDVVAPPWLRVPSGASHDPPHPPSTRPAVLRAVAADPPPTAAPAAPVPRPPATPAPPPVRHHPARARPPVAPEPGILGLSRLARGRIGSRLFTLFFVAVYAVILIQLVMVLLHG